MEIKIYYFIPSRNLSNSLVQCKKFPSSLALYQIKVLSTLLEGGMGLKPRPGLLPIKELSNCHFGAFGSNV